VPKNCKMGNEESKTSPTVLWPTLWHTGAAANILPRNACTTSPQHVNNTMILLLCNEDWPLHIF